MGHSIKSYREMIIGEADDVLSSEEKNQRSRCKWKICAHNKNLQGWFNIKQSLPNILCLKCNSKLLPRIHGGDINSQYITFFYVTEKKTHLMVNFANRESSPTYL